MNLCLGEHFRRAQRYVEKCLNIGCDSRQQEPERSSVMGNTLLVGKNVLITGAGRNIGRSIAIEMAKQGAKVYCTDISEQICKDAEKEIATYCPDSHWFIADVSKKEDTDALCCSLADGNIRIDVLVNNVGIKVPVKAKDFDSEEWHSVFNTNCFGPLYLSKLMARMMIQNSVKGSIIFLSSVHQWIPFRFASYSASKAALGMIIKELAVDLSPHDIRVNGIAPGYVAEDEMGRSVEFGYSLLRKTSINPSYIGRAAVYLASDYFSKFTTGTVLKIDAGLSMYNFRIDMDPPQN